MGPPPSGAGLAAQAATRLGRPQRLLVGLGAHNEFSDIRQQDLRLDIVDRYLVSYPGQLPWPAWNSPRGAYVDRVTAEVDALGAVPMFTLYQMATVDDRDRSGLTDAVFMSTMWSNARLLFEKLGRYDRPAIVHVEPDLWGFMLRVSGGAPARLPTRVAADVPECVGLPEDLSGLVACMLRLARQLSPRVLVGFSPSDYWEFSAEQNIAWFKALGADAADLVVIQTLDRDAGCFEVNGPLCDRRSTEPWYWDATNRSSPNFEEHLRRAQVYAKSLDRPLLWWQTPMGVPSDRPGGSSGRWRDNRVEYFLTRPAELVAAGAVGVVFSAGAIGQTTIRTDDGQFQRLSRDYLASPVLLP